MKRKLIPIAAAVFAAFFAVSAVMLWRQDTQQKQSEETFQKVAALVQTEPPAVEEAAEQPITAAEKYGDVQKQNPDFVGWLSIPGTAIHYPVMQTVDRPDYYLKRDFNGAYSSHGTPYLQENCVVGTSDNLVIYGHNMKNGSMFADLCKYKDEAFYREHSTIHFDTMAGFGNYEIVAVFQTVAYSQEGFKYYHFVNAADKAFFDEYVASCKALALYDTGVDTQYGDRLITLSTCEYSRTNGRMVVVAKLVESHA